MSARARIVWRSSADVRVPAPPVPEARTPWWRHVYRDYRRHQMSGESRIATAFSQGFWASAAYRVSRAARPVPFFSAIAQKIVELVTAISLPAECAVGEGLWLSASGNIVIDGASRLGHNCTIAHGVTLEAAGRGEARGAPVIEDRVFIGAHAILIGKITVGEDAMVCPGAVLAKSVPPRAVVMGNPARVMSLDGSFDVVVYDDMEMDPARTASRLQR